jgi:hypothetical protein
MKPYIPIYKRKPNEFIEYEPRPFNDGAGHNAMLKVAVYRDKNGKRKEEVAQVVWK